MHTYTHLQLCQLEDTLQLSNEVRGVYLPASFFEIKKSTRSKRFLTKTIYRESCLFSWLLYQKLYLTGEMNLQKCSSLIPTTRTDTPGHFDTDFNAAITFCTFKSWEIWATNNSCCTKDNIHHQHSLKKAEIFFKFPHNLPIWILP